MRMILTHQITLSSGKIIFCIVLIIIGFEYLFSFSIISCVPHIRKLLFINYFIKYVYYSSPYEWFHNLEVIKKANYLVLRLLINKYPSNIFPHNLYT